MPVILTDIEGTTTPVTFVHDVLFPYAAAHLPAYVESNHLEPRVALVLDEVRAALGRPDASLQACTDQLLAWIAADAKVTPLKTLQGWIWEAGYHSGAIKAPVYPDAHRWLQAWHGTHRLAVYSSGSVHAQKLLFRHTDHGDLSPWFTGWYDTQIGHKREVASYRAIAAALQTPADQIHFLSDVLAELDAARAAGMATTHLVRDGQATGAHPVAHTFDDVILEFP